MAGRRERGDGFGQTCETAGFRDLVFADMRAGVRDDETQVLGAAEVEAAKIPLQLDKRIRGRRVLLAGLAKSERVGAKEVEQRSRKVSVRRILVKRRRGLREPRQVLHPDRVLEARPSFRRGFGSADRNAQMVFFGERVAKDLRTEWSQVGLRS